MRANLTVIGAVFVVHVAAVVAMYFKGATAAVVDEKNGDDDGDSHPKTKGSGGDGCVEDPKQQLVVPLRGGREDGDEDGDGPDDHDNNNDGEQQGTVMHDDNNNLEEHSEDAAGADAARTDDKHHTETKKEKKNEKVFPHTWMGACARARFPSWYAKVFFALYPGTLFAAMQIVVGADTNNSNSNSNAASSSPQSPSNDGGVVNDDGDDGDSSVKFAAFLSLIIGFAAPLLVLFVCHFFIAATRRKFIFNNRDPGKSTPMNRRSSMWWSFFVPSGDWTPHITRLAFSNFFGQSRAGKIWSTTAFWSPMSFAIAAGVSATTAISCRTLFSLLAAYHFSIVVVVCLFVPFRSSADNVLSATGLMITAFMITTSIVEQYRLVVFLSSMQTGVTVLRIVLAFTSYHAVRYFRRNRNKFPSRNQFSWQPRKLPSCCSIRSWLPSGSATAAAVDPVVVVGAADVDANGEDGGAILNENERPLLADHNNGFHNDNGDLRNDVVGVDDEEMGLLQHVLLPLGNSDRGDVERTGATTAGDGVDVEEELDLTLTNNDARNDTDAQAAPAADGTLNDDDSDLAALLISSSSASSVGNNGNDDENNGQPLLVADDLDAFCATDDHTTAPNVSSTGAAAAAATSVLSEDAPKVEEEEEDAIGVAIRAAGGALAAERRRSLERLVLVICGQQRRRQELERVRLLELALSL